MCHGSKRGKCVQEGVLNGISCFGPRRVDFKNTQENMFSQSLCENSHSILFGSRRQFPIRQKRKYPSVNREDEGKSDFPNFRAQLQEKGDSLKGMHGSGSLVSRWKKSCVFFSVIDAETVG